MRNPASLHVAVNDEIEALDLMRALGEVPSDRRELALGYRFERDRRLSVAVYLLLKDLLREVYGIEGMPRLETGANGKPFLPEHPGIYFNFSHCSKAAACVVADRPVGIDVEAIAPVDEEVAQRVLSGEELCAVRTSVTPEIAFARYWTQKESLVKLSGRGLEDDRLKTLLSDGVGASLETIERPDKGYVLTVAV